MSWRNPLCTPGELDEALERLGHHTGLRRSRAARKDIRPGSNSPRESALRLGILRAGFPEPELNGEIPLRNGQMTWGDLVFRAPEVVVEFDDEQHRTNRRQFDRYVERLNDLAEAGWFVIRVRGTDYSDALARLGRALHVRKA